MNSIANIFENCSKHKHHWNSVNSTLFIMHTWNWFKNIYLNVKRRNDSANKLIIIELILNQEKDFDFLHVCDRSYDVQNVVIDLEKCWFSVLIWFTHEWRWIQWYFILFLFFLFLSLWGFNFVVCVSIV